MKHTREKKNEITRSIRMLAVLMVPVVALILAATAPQVWAFGGHHWPEKEEFEDAQCGFEVNVTDFDTGFFACVDAEGWKWLKIRRGWDLLFLTWAAGNLGRLGITELCFESSEPEGEFQEILDLFPPGECKFIAKRVDGGYLKSTDELTHDFACPPNPEEGQIRYKQGTNGNGFEPFEDGTCVEPGVDLIIEWDELESRLVDVRFEEEDGEEIVVYDCVNNDSGVEVDSYEVVVETGELESGEDFEPSQTLTFDPFDEGTSVTIPGDFIKENTPYKFEHLTIEESGNKSIIELEFATGSFCED